jgi:hypothetical protein
MYELNIEIESKDKKRAFVVENGVMYCSRYSATWGEIYHAAVMLYAINLMAALDLCHPCKMREL